MNRARDVALGGAGRTWPNPIVGAVVVRDGREVGAGYHRRYGEAHAEAVALDAAGEAARGATLYATLEPCAHHGRTPPCVDRIIGSGVARVVFPAIDPDPRVRGRGIAALRAAGVAVDVGCLADASILDALPFYRDRLGLAPTVTLKMAVTQDGMVARAPGTRDDVTGEDARADAHALRALHDAVVVGVETVRIDRPRLDCRRVAGGVDREPVPVVLDTNARTPTDTVWAREGRDHIVVCAPDADRARVEALRRAGARVLAARTAPRGLDVDDAVHVLAEHGLTRLLVEGGPRVFWSFVDAGRWDAAYEYRSRQSFGPGGVRFYRGDVERFPGRRVDTRTIGLDRRHGFVNEARWAELGAALARAGLEA
jgi:diaminohydroxyphosphoribosylaminopyrimidine deaminase/5-amino-6-(5-phosphoribosylamino)uracil reductase